MITNLIRKANSEHEIYFLLTAYIQSARFCEKPENVPNQVTSLPLSGKPDLQARFDELMVAMDLAIRRFDDQACAVIKEPLVVFNTALNCLCVLDQQRSSRPAGVNPQAMLTWSTIPAAKSGTPAAGQAAASQSIAAEQPSTP